MIPVIAIIGQPNVGKSTLFNALVGKPQALVHDMPGVTRDRHFGQAKWKQQPYIVIDTGGVSGNEQGIDGVMAGQSWQAAIEADVILFVVDGRAGMTPSDHFIAEALRRLNKPVFCVVNKTDGIKSPESVVAEFYALGFHDVYPIAASHGRGLPPLMEAALAKCLENLSVEAEPEAGLPEDKPKGIKIAIVGRPNVGKSTLVNRLLGEERMAVFDAPGTTRDSIEVALTRNGRDYTLVDTAGVRRRKNIDEALEKFSVVKTLRSVEAADVVIYVIDGKEAVTDQDLSLLGFVINAGRALVIAVNKWDGLDTDQREHIKTGLERQLEFVNFARTYFISALHGSGVGILLDAVHTAYESATRKLSTNKLTRLLEKAVTAHQPPLVHGHRIKLRYAHSGGHLPPIIVIHGNQTESLPKAYQRYLMHFFIDELKLVGTPLRFEFKTSDNPFAGRKNILTPRQEKKRERLRQFVKKKKR